MATKHLVDTIQVAEALIERDAPIAYVDQLPQGILVPKCHPKSTTIVQHKEGFLVVFCSKCLEPMFKTPLLQRQIQMVT